jgi:hypothetical protein
MNTTMFSNHSLPCGRVIVRQARQKMHFPIRLDSAGGARLGYGAIPTFAIRFRRSV